MVAVSGTITEQDSTALENLIRGLGNRSLSVWLDSPGGDVFAAIRMGRSIRKYEALTVIPVPSKCYSSCALIFIAGVRRHNLGKLGLHRPYLASTPQSRQTIEKQVPRMLQLVKQYVAEMGITDNFYYQMVNTEPSKMAIYRTDDYANLVPATDPVFQEIQIAYDARRYGVTALEMRQREQDAETCFRRPSSEILTCQWAINWGLSERVYRERSAKTTACELGDEDSRVLLALLRGQHHDHPLVLKHEACVRKIMAGPAKSDDWEDIK